MKFAEHLSAHITPEWRKQYIQYEQMKDMLYEAKEVEQLIPESERPRHFDEFEENFLQFCAKELSKINTFFDEKLAEAKRKFTDLESELSNLNSNSVSQHHTSSQSFRHSSFVNIPKDEKKAIPQKKQSRKVAKKKDALKLAFSEFYLSLVLLQNYQTLNFTGFRKILKKHDKLMNTSSGNQWRQQNVDGAPFYTSKSVLRLIEDTENIFTEKLEEGDRSKAMKRLRVPPLNAHQSLWTTFRVGAYSGAFFVLLIVLIVSLSMVQTQFNYGRMARLFRGPFFLCVFTFLIGINVYGWRRSGVNHVLIFELDPRDHVSEQHLFELSFFFAMIWALSLLGYIFSHALRVNPDIFPLVNIFVMVFFFLNPLDVFNKSSRYWLLHVLGRIISAPFWSVTFADFWLADQLNSLAILFSDSVYLSCFYLNSNLFNSPGNSDQQCLFKSRTFLIIRAFFTAMPAWFRFAQCLRRYRDENPHRFHPHLVNAGKYSTTFFVVIFSTLTEMTPEVKNDPLSSPMFVFWIISLIISSIYTYLWDIKMDWGLMDSNPNKEYPLLREEIVYSSPYYYYFAYVENFIGRTMWTFTISLNHVGGINPDLLSTGVATFELFRRFIWNYFRLENEHLNNCGEFRAVRDISIAPMTPSVGAAKTVSLSDSNGSAKKAKKRRALQYTTSNRSSSPRTYQDSNTSKGEVALLMSTKHASYKNYDKL